MMQRLGLAAITLTLLLSGCALQSRTDYTQNLAEHQRQLAALSHWQLSGKLGIRAPSDSGSASLNWRQDGRRYRIDLSGPLGQKRMLINGRPGRVTLAQAGQKTRSAASAEELIAQVANWNLPVTQLGYWVRGLPSPSSPIEQIQKDERGLITELQQGGWHISYAGYAAQPLNGASLPLPQKIIAQYADLRLTLIARSWQLEDPK
jgi:outer membrane lipoprotein LolB